MREFRKIHASCGETSYFLNRNARMGTRGVERDTQCHVPVPLDVFTNSLKASRSDGISRISDNLATVTAAWHPLCYSPNYFGISLMASKIPCKSADLGVGHGPRLGSTNSVSLAQPHRLGAHNGHVAMKAIHLNGLRYAVHALE